MTVSSAEQQLLGTSKNITKRNGRSAGASNLSGLTEMISSSLNSAASATNNNFFTAASSSLVSNHPTPVILSHRFMRTLCNINERYPKEFAKLPAIIADSISSAEGLEDGVGEVERESTISDDGDERSAEGAAAAAAAAVTVASKRRPYLHSSPKSNKISNSVVVPVHSVQKLGRSSSSSMLLTIENTPRRFSSNPSSTTEDQTASNTGQTSRKTSLLRVTRVVGSRKASAIGLINNKASSTISEELEEEKLKSTMVMKDRNEEYGGSPGGAKPELNIIKFQPFPLQPNSAYSIKKLSKRQLSKMPQSIKSKYLAYEQPNENITQSISESAARAKLILEKELQEKIRVAEVNRQRLMLLRGVIDQENDFFPHMQLAQQRMQDKVRFVKSAKVKKSGDRTSDNSRL